MDSSRPNAIEEVIEIIKIVSIQNTELICIQNAREKRQPSTIKLKDSNGRITLFEVYPMYVHACGKVGAPPCGYHAGIFCAARCGELLISRT